MRAENDWGVSDCRVNGLNGKDGNPLSAGKVLRTRNHEKEVERQMSKESELDLGEGVCQGQLPEKVRGVSPGGQPGQIRSITLRFEKGKTHIWDKTEVI